MRFLLYFFILISFNVEASILDKVKNLISSFFKEPNKEMITLPDLPLIQNNTKNISLNKKLNNVVIDSETLKKYNIVYIYELYESLLNRKPSDLEVSKWFNTLSQGASREGVYRAIVLGDEYRLLESGSSGYKEEGYKFVSYILSKYVGENFDLKKISIINIFTLKRLVVDKMIDMSTLLKRNPNDLYRWYAVLSSDLATKFPKILKNNVRSVKNANFHKKWATNVSEQIILSELIIKIHISFNSFIL